VAIAWLACAGCSGDVALDDDAATDETADAPLVQWNELMFLRRTEWNGFIMTADRFGAGLGVIAHVPGLASWRGASGDGTVIAWVDPSNETTLYALREGEASPQAIPHVTATRGWSPVGARMLMLLAEPGASPRTVVHDFGTDAQRDLPIPAASVTIKWSDDGERVAYRLDDALWFADVDAGTATELRPLAPNGSFDWSADGTQLVVGEDGVLAVIDVDGGEQSIIGEWGDVGPAYLSVSPDGEWIAWLVADGGQGGVMRIDGSERDRIVEFVSGTPAWNYSSERFTFAEQGHGPDCLGSGCTGIVLVDAAAGERRLLGGTRSDWAPGDDWLAIDLDSDDTQRVKTRNVATDESFDVSALADDDPTRDSALVWR
jgi:hypothetical protein